MFVISFCFKFDETRLIRNTVLFEIILCSLTRHFIIFYWSALFARGMLADSGLSANICWWMNHQHIVGRKTLLNVAADRQPWALVNFSEYQDFLDTPRCARCRSSLRELLQLGDWRTRRYVVPSALPGAYWIWGANNWQEHRLTGRI